MQVISLLSPKTKEQTLHDSTDIDYIKQPISWRQKAEERLPKAGRREVRTHWLTRRVSACEDANVLEV